MSDRSIRSIPLRYFTPSVVALTAIVLALIWSENDMINGPYYWKWDWYTSPSGSIPLFMVSIIPFALAQWFFFRKEKATLAFVFLILGALYLQLSNVWIHSYLGIYQRITDVVLSPSATSYFTAALEFDSLGQLFREYESALNNFPSHARNKPVGPVLYYYLSQRIFSSPSQAAFLGGTLILFLSQLGALLVYKAILQIFPNGKKQAWVGASLFVLMPAFSVFSPEFDQLFPILTLVLLVTWDRTLKTAKLKWLLGFAATVALVPMITWNVLVTGLFLLLYTIWAVPRYRVAQPFHQIAKFTAITALLCFVFYFALYLTTGYNLVTVFQTCVSNAIDVEIELNRPWRFTIFYDLYDFFLGAGFISALSTLWLFWSSSSSKEHRFLAAYVMAQLIFVALAYLLPAETARVWFFMQPLSLLIATIVPAQLTSRNVFVVLLCQWSICVTMNLHMSFLRA